MFVHQCTACERRQLIFPSQVTGMADYEGAAVLAFTCWCGAEQATRMETKAKIAKLERLSVNA